MENHTIEITPADFPLEARYSYAVETALRLAGGREYPLLLTSIFSETNWKILTYSELAAKHNKSIYAIIAALGSRDGTCCLKGGKYYLFYNDSESISSARQRFTIAHEIGHIVLGHLKFRCKLNPDQYQVLEKEANAFARNLLMPVPFPINWTDVETVSEFFKVSKKAAWVRLQFLGFDLTVAQASQVSLGFF